MRHGVSITVDTNSTNNSHRPLFIPRIFIYSFWISSSFEDISSRPQITSSLYILTLGLILTLDLVHTLTPDLIHIHVLLLKRTANGIQYPADIDILSGYARNASHDD